VSKKRKKVGGKKDKITQLAWSKKGEPYEKISYPTEKTKVPTSFGGQYRFVALMGFQGRRIKGTLQQKTSTVSARPDQTEGSKLGTKAREKRARGIVSY